MTTPLTDSDHVVVAGAGLAGWRFVEALRRDGYQGALTLLGDEAHPPYDRPPLTKQILTGKWSRDQSTLTTLERLGELDVAAHFGVPVESLDPARHAVTLADGRVVSGTRVVIATGTRARRLGFSANEHLHTVRTVDDVQSLLDDLEDVEFGTEVVIIGGGFVGAEVATSLRARGFAPVVLESAPLPLFHVLGETAAEWLSSLPADAGVEIRNNQSIADVVEADGLLEVRFDDGTTLRAVVVIEAVGAVVNTEWLEGSGLEVRNGLVVDEYLLATPTIGAIGDVARFTWRHEPFVDEVRIEHWQTATDHATSLAATMISGSAAAEPLSMLPYFWSDQYGKKIQMLGHPAPSDDVVMVAGSVEEGKWLAVYSRDGVVTGLLSLNQPRGLMVSRELVATHASLESAVEGHPWQS